MNKFQFFPACKGRKVYYRYISSCLYQVFVRNYSDCPKLSSVQVKKQMSSPVCQPPSSLNVQRLKNRAEEQIRQKQRLVNALKAGLSPEGQRLFTAIKKTIEDVSWNKDDIIVMDKVCISKPYTPDCVKALNESVPEKAIEHVRKIVEKHIQDREEIKTRGN